MKNVVEFKDLNEGDRFECYGDVHLNYNSRKICECVKLDATTAKEVGGILFNIRDIDTVFKLEDVKLVERVEKFLDDAKKELSEDEYQKVIHELKEVVEFRMSELGM